MVGKFNWQPNYNTNLYMAKSNQNGMNLLAYKMVYPLIKTLNMIHHNSVQSQFPV